MQKIAGIFQTARETEKFLQKLPNEFYAHSQFEVNHSQFEVNDALLTTLKDKKLDVEKNHVVVIVETPNNLLLKIHSLIKSNCGKYVEPETLITWKLKGLD